MNAALNRLVIGLLLLFALLSGTAAALVSFHLWSDRTSLFGHTPDSALTLTAGPDDEAAAARMAIGGVWLLWILLLIGCAVGYRLTRSVRFSGSARGVRSGGRPARGSSPGSCGRSSGAGRGG